MTPSGPRRGSGGGNNNFTTWTVTIVAAFAVIIGGWFLGQALAHWMGPKDQQTAQLPTPTPIATPVASPTESVAQATEAPTTRPTPAPSPTAVPTTAPTPTLQPTAAPTTARTIAPTAAPTVKRTPLPTSQPRTILPVARRPEPTAAPAVSTVAPSTGESTVRSYIEALRRGDPQTAATYLGNGVPDEDFIDENTRITSLDSTRNSDGSYKVVVGMRTTKGEYSETFVVAGTGTAARILEKTAIKP
jgi:hypothetical protein